MAYSLNGTDLSTFGIIPGRASDSNIALSGHLDFPKRRNKTFQSWGDQNGVEPYVSDDEIMFNGRDIIYNGYVEGNSKEDIELKLLDLYGLLDSVESDELVPLETSFGTFQVYVNDSIEVKYHKNNIATIQVKFREPIVDLTGGIIPDNGDPLSVNGIDGIDFDALGFSIVNFYGMGFTSLSLSGILERPKPKAQNTIGFYQEPFQVTKVEARKYSLNGLIKTDDYPALEQVIKNLYAILKDPGVRVLYLKNDRIRLAFCEDGFEVTNIVTKPTARAIVEIHFTEADESQAGADYKLLGTTLNEFVTTTVGQKILLKL